MAFRVLIVDDDRFNLALLGDVCRSGGYEIVTASDGSEALEQAGTQKPDAIVLDLMMPKLDGFEVCARLRKDPATAATPVLIVTAIDDVPNRVRALELGADNYLIKPFRPAEVLARIAAAIEYRRIREKIAASEEDGTPPLVGGIGDFADLQRDLARETSRAARSKRALACAALVPKLGRAPVGKARRTWLTNHAAAIEQSVRGSDRVFLLGSDEIVVLLPECDTAALAPAVERIRAALGEHAEAFAIGAASWADSVQDSLLRRARAAAAEAL